MIHKDVEMMLFSPKAHQWQDTWLRQGQS